MFETRKELFSKIDAQAADITRLETELTAAQDKASAATDSAETIAGLNEDLAAAQTALTDLTASTDATIAGLRSDLAAEKAKTTPEAIQALVTAEVAGSGHPPVVVETKTGETAAQDEIKSLTGLAKVTASFKASNASKTTSN